MVAHDLLQQFIDGLHTTHDSAQEFADAAAGVVGTPEFVGNGDDAVG
ncbi:MAG: hypothetical protein GW907_04510 [Betaproteobacteria bacterium]|nr:hypothetical protein [Betaproteobacteria bacterium]